MYITHFFSLFTIYVLVTFPGRAFPTNIYTYSVLKTLHLSLLHTEGTILAVRVNWKMEKHGMNLMTARRTGLPIRSAFSSISRQGDVRSEDKKRAILLSNCGAQTYPLIKNLLTPIKPKDNSFQDIIQLITDHLQPKTSVTMQCFKFYSLTQKPV